jgi:hypothetical protein
MAANAAMTSSSNRGGLPHWIHSLHIWLPMIGFGATLVFAVTGLRPHDYDRMMLSIFLPRASSSTILSR